MHQVQCVCHIFTGDRWQLDGFPFFISISLSSVPSPTHPFSVFPSPFSLQGLGCHCYMAQEMNPFSSCPVLFLERGCISSLILMRVLFFFLMVEQTSDLSKDQMRIVSFTLLTNQGIEAFGKSLVHKQACQLWKKKNTFCTDS